MRGVLTPDEAPTFHELLARRYRCTACGATSTVVPVDVLPRKHFGAVTIALAFALYGALRQSLDAVYRALNPTRARGYGARGWDSVLRWLSVASTLFPDVRPSPSEWSSQRVAERAAMTLAALIPDESLPIPGRNAHALPIVVRPDRRLGGDAADGPWEVIVPAQPDDPDAARGTRFRSAVAFTKTELFLLNALYKSRWPSMENELKALQSHGFGRNRARRLELVVSRGTDGEVTRLREREARWRGKVCELEAEPLSGKAVGRLIAAAGKVEQARAKQTVVLEAAPPKHARVEGGGERLGKWPHLLVHNAMALALATSPDEEVRVMAPTTVGELLLGQSALTVVETERLTMWVDALDAAEGRRRQAALVEVFNNLGLRC